jgi:hypothetical protein
MEVTESDATGVTAVEGNHGGAKLPCENLRSKKTFRVPVLMFWMRPPTIVRVLIALPLFISAPLPSLDIVAMAWDKSAQNRFRRTEQK